jgi:hypothetical protein
MERAMTTSLETTTERPRHVLRRLVILGGAATAAVIGLLISQSFFYTPPAPKAEPNAAQSEAAPAPEPVTLKFVPSPVIETNPQFFFGSGDGSNGYYAERPTHPARPNQ